MAARIQRSTQGCIQGQKASPGYEELVKVCIAYAEKSGGLIDGAGSLEGLILTCLGILEKGVSADGGDML